MPGAPERRPDAFEHDLQIGALREGLVGTAGEVIDIDWRAPLDRFAGFDIALLGSSWDYTDHPEEFCAKLEALEEAGVLVCNPSAMVRWNADKAYLKQLELSGIPAIPTLWRDDPSGDDVAAAFDHFGCQQVVVKRRVGAGALGQHTFTKRNAPASDWRMGHAALIQPLLPAIREEGELSFIFLDGEFSHGVLKQPASGDYRIQSLYGGTERVLLPSLPDIRVAADVLDVIPFDKPLYARIDMVRGTDGILRLIEAELIEPYLYPLQRRDFGKALARAVLARGTSG